MGWVLPVIKIISQLHRLIKYCIVGSLLQDFFSVTEIQGVFFLFLLIFLVFLIFKMFCLTLVRCFLASTPAQLVWTQVTVWLWCTKASKLEGVKCTELRWTPEEGTWRCWELSYTHCLILHLYYLNRCRNNIEKKLLTNKACCTYICKSQNL